MESVRDFGVPLSYDDSYTIYLRGGYMLQTV